MAQLRNVLLMIPRSKCFQIIRPHALDMSSAKSARAFGDHHLNITVEQYDFSNKSPLKFSSLPLIAEKPSNASTHLNFYPIELLYIVPNIRYNNSQSA